MLFLFSLFVSVSLLPSPLLLSTGPPPFTPAGGLPTLGREGRMVVLSLVLGLSEQDDFANIPDLQNPGTQQNQNAQGDKRYEHGRGLRQRQQQQRRRHGEATCLSWP